MNKIIDSISNIGIVPVVKINNPDHALPIAHALFEGGLQCVEITFRTPHALSSIRSITHHLPEMIVGAGTVTSIEQAKDAIDAGAQFIVTPGFNPDLVSWCVKANIPIIPGVMTPTEIESALRLGLTHLKFFPAESSGGVPILKDLSGPYPNVRFMPSGGINIHNLKTYLDLKNVFAVGSSSMIPLHAISNENWDEITTETENCIKKMLNLSIDSIYLGNHYNILEDNEIGKLQTVFNPLIKITHNDDHDIIKVSTASIPRTLHYLNHKGILTDSRSLDDIDLDKGLFTLNLDLSSYKIQLVEKE